MGIIISIAIILSAVVVMAIVFLATFFIARALSDKGLMEKTPSNSFPARVDLLGLDDPLLKETFTRAMAWWEDELGIKAFTKIPDSDGVLIYVEICRQGDFYARTKFMEDKRVVLILLNKGRYLSDPIERRVKKAFHAFCHEIGHVFGLDHDDYVFSVMFPGTNSGHFTVSDKDLEIVRKRISGDN